MRRLLVAAAAAVLLTACTSAVPRPAPTSTPPPGVTRTPEVSTTAIPRPRGWHPRETTVDGRTLPWASRREVSEVLDIWNSYACTSDLPRPAEILEATFVTETGADAVLEVARFADGATATRFQRRYFAGSASCPQPPTRIGETAQHRLIDGATWTEIVAPRQEWVFVVIVNERLDGSAVDRLTAQL